MSSTDQPLVSVITVVLNGEKHIEETIQSVVSQTWKNIEYIVIDGGSTDTTIEIIKKYEKNISYWVSRKDNGLYWAMNDGIKQAHGSIIGILNADDCYFPKAVEEVVSFFARENSVEVCCSNVLLVQEFDNMINIRQRIPDISGLETKMTVYHPGCFVKKNVYDRAGGFDIRYRISSDYDFLVRVFKQGFKFGHLNKTLVRFRAGGLAGQSPYRLIECYRIAKEHKLDKKYHHLLRYAWLKIYKAIWTIIHFLATITGNKKRLEEYRIRRLNHRM